MEVLFTITKKFPMNLLKGELTIIADAERPEVPFGEAKYSRAGLSMLVTPSQKIITGIF